MDNTTRIPRASWAQIMDEGIPAIKEEAFYPIMGHFGILAKGSSGLLVAYPKAGKTSLLAGLAEEWASLGYSVLFLSEESRMIWFHRLRTPSHHLGGVEVAFALNWSKREMILEIAGGTEDIIILDTTRLLGIDDENDAGQVSKALTPFIAICQEEGKTLLAAHHAGKESGRGIKGAAGSHAWAGAVDSVMMLEHDAKQDRNTLSVTSRILCPVSSLMYQWKPPGRLIPIGDTEGVALDDIAERLLRVMGDEWVTAGELRKTIGEPRPGGEQIRRALGKLIESEVIERDPIADGTSRPGVIYHWRSSQPPTNLPQPFGEG